MLSFVFVEDINLNKNKIFGIHIIKKLGLSNDDYVIFASGAMVAHGVYSNNEDIDLLIKPKKLKELVKKGLLIKHEKYGNTTYYSDKDNICDCYPTLSDVCNVNDKYWFDNSEIIQGVRVQSIAALKKFYGELYKKRGLEKHKKRLELLNSL